MKGVLQLLVVCAAFAAGVMPISGATIERRFSTTVYPAMQRVITPITNSVPIALFDLLTVAGAIAVIAAILHGIRGARRERSPRPLLATLRQLGTAGAIVYLAFLILWGFNYRRVAMTERLVMARPAPATEAVVALGLDAVRRLNELHAGAHEIGWARDPRENASLLDAYAAVQQRMSDAPPAVPGRLKQSLYGPYFRWTSIDGMVNPFALEVLANPDLLPYERPFVAAHEWAHLAGYADESEANFVGWLTCVRGDVPSQYSGWMSLYWQIAGELSAGERATLWDALTEGPRADVQAIVERMQRGQLPLLRNASWRVYDSYLRANRVEEGIRSYGNVITLLLRAKFEDGWLPVRQGSAASSR